MHVSLTKVANGIFCTFQINASVTPLLDVELLSSDDSERVNNAGTDEDKVDILIKASSNHRQTVLKELIRVK